jgi:hypothetical protein
MIIGITGKMGSGKTLLMSLFGFFFSEIVPVYANYSTIFAHPLKSLKQLFSIEKGVVLIDEIHLQIDSRSWYGKKQIQFTHWLNQTRKKNLLLIYTSQHFKQVDVRLRRATDLLIQAVSFRNFFKYIFIEPNTGIILKVLKANKEKMKEFYNIYNTFEFIHPLT